MKEYKYIQGPGDFGGTLNWGKRKEARPLIFGEPFHHILKASQKTNLLPQTKQIEMTIHRLNEKFGVRNLGVAVHVDHIHQIPVIPNRETYVKWSRSVSGVLTREFDIQWKQLPFTKYVAGDERYIENLIDYVNYNRREAEFILNATQRVDQWLLRNDPLRTM